MGMKGRVLAVFAGVIVIAAVAVTAAFGAHKADPGVTSYVDPDRRDVPAHRASRRCTRRSRPPRRRTSTTSTTTAASTAARSRSTSYDDAYDPSKTVPLTQQLVEQDKVFAVFGSLGTAPNLATWSYLNQNKVPQVLIATGDSYWGFSHEEVPVDDRLAAGLSG